MSGLSEAPRSHKLTLSLRQALLLLGVGLVHVGALSLLRLPSAPTPPPRTIVHVAWIAPPPPQTVSLTPVPAPVEVSPVRDVPAASPQSTPQASPVPASPASRPPVVQSVQTRAAEVRTQPVTAVSSVPVPASEAAPAAHPESAAAEPRVSAMPMAVAKAERPPTPEPAPVAAPVRSAPKTVSIHGVSYRQPPAIEYPEAADGAEGSVLLRVRVSGQGEVEGVSVERSSGHVLLDRAAQQQIRAARFHPYRENGVAQPVHVLVPIDFTFE